MKNLRLTILIFAVFIMIFILSACEKSEPYLGEDATVFENNETYLDGDEYIPDELIPLADPSSEEDILRKIATEIFDLCNDERVNAGLEKFRWDENLYAASVIRASELLKLYSHKRPDDSACFTVLDETGIKYRSAGENIAIGFSDAKSVVKAWMNSNGHRKNILGDYTYLTPSLVLLPEDGKYKGYAAVQLFYTPFD